jgi:methyltransferase
MIIIIIAAVVFGFLIVEAVRAARNERALFAQGGIEPPGDVYRAMRVAYPSAFLAMCLEGLVRGLPSGPAVAAGAVLFALAKALKWWAMLALGPAWTFRVVVVPGGERVTSGPYRIFRHPNYVGVVGELVSVALMSGARVAGPIATVAFGLLMVKRVAVENRAVDAILRRSSP